MWKIQKRVTDGDGTHPWQSAGPERFVTLEDAEFACGKKLLEFLSAPSYDGLRCARFRIVLATASVHRPLQ